MMARFIAGRVAQAILVLWAAYTVTFLILYVLPGDTLLYLLAANDVSISSLSADELAKAREYYGLDGTLLEQYLRNLAGIVTGDFGTSVSKSQPVGELLAARLPNTVVLGAVSVGIALVLGVVLAVGATYLRWRPVRLILGRLPAVGVSAPSFWVGLLLIQVFAFGLGWFPSGGAQTWQAIVLPAVTMAIPSAAVLAQVLARSLTDTLGEPYVATATAKGLPRIVVYARHAFKNAALPTLTILGLLVGATVAGAVTTETVFSRVGIGRLAQEAVLGQDIPVVLAIVVIAAAAFVFVNLVVDLLYVVLDPRVRIARKVTRA